MKIGVALDAFGLPFRAALARVAKLGVGGVACEASGDLTPAELSASARREIGHLLRSHQLQLTALVCPLSRGLDVAADLERRIEQIRQTMTLSFDLGARIAIVEAGPIPKSHDASSPMTEALAELARCGDRTGTVLALDTGRESGAALAGYLKRFDTGGLGVNFRPASLFLNGFDPIAELSDLRDRTVHVHAADAKRGRNLVPLGHGDLDWLQLAGTLAAIDYRGWVVIAGAAGDAADGVRFLKRFS